MKTLWIIGLMFSLTAAGAAPVVWQVSDPVRPGETLMMFGDGLGGIKQVGVCPFADGPAGKPGAPVAGSFAYGAGASVAQASNSCLKVTLSSRLKPGLVGLIWEGGGVTVNRPALWWGQIEWGGKMPLLRLFGKNLGGPAGQVYLKGPKTLAVSLGKQGDMWAARASLAGCPAGEYQVFYHSGHGGPRGWSMPLALTVAPPRSWPSREFNVRDYGANGLGTQDDSAALQAALDAAGLAGGGVVMLPRGRYQATTTLKVPRFTVLRGASADQTALFWPDLPNPPEALVQGSNSFALENLTLYASNARHVIVGDLGSLPEAGNVRLWRVRVRANAYRGHLSAEAVDKRHRDLIRLAGGDTVRLGGPNLRIVECDFYGNGRALYLSRVRDGVVRNNHFYNGRHGWYCISGSDGLIFEDNRITGADLMATGGGLNCLDGSSYSQNVYYARNKLVLMHGWDREAMTSDAGGGLYYGPVAKVEGVRLTVPEALKPGGKNWTGAGVFVFRGKGATQYRRVVQVEGDQVTVDRAWDVPPDETSLIGITMLQRRYLLCGNDFSDAGIAIQFYGTSLEHVVADNTCARAGGYQGIGKPYGGYQNPPDKNPCHQPSWFCQYVGNTISEGSIYRSGANNSILSGDSVIGVFGWPLTKDWSWPYNVGSVVRRNHLENNARLHLGGSANELPSVSDVVVEHNVVRQAEQGVRLDRAVSGVLIRENRFEGVREPLAGDGAGRATYGLGQLAAAELGRLQVAAREAGVREDVSRWPELAALAELQSMAALTPEARQVGARLSAGLLAGLRRQQVALDGGLISRLLGLDLQLQSSSTLPAVLQKGGGGPVTLNLQVSLARSVPQWLAGAEVQWPQTAASAAVTLAEGRAVLPLTLEMPEGVWGRVTLPVKLLLNLSGMVVEVPRTLTVGTGQLREWLLLGPLPNKSGQPLDLTIYPPEDALNLPAGVATAAGKLEWQTVSLSGEWLDLNGRLQTREPGVAYAVACVEAEQETAAVLQIGSSGGVAAMLNGGYVWSVNQSRNAVAGQDRVPVTLRQGENVLLVKLSTVTEQWRFAAELVPVGGRFPGRVAVVAAKQIASRAALAAPAPRTAPQDGEVRFAAGVDWKLLHADDFATAGLSGRWRTAVGGWKAGNGLLQSTGDKAFLAYAEPLPAPVRIEYDTRVIGDTGGDLSAFWLSDPKDHASGTLVGFGSNGNTRNKVLVAGEEVALAERPLVSPGKWHHVIMQVLPDGRVQLIVDGQLSLDHRGPAPGAAKHPGLWTWGPQGAFARVRVYGG